MVLASKGEVIDGPTPVLCHPRNDTQRNSLSPVSRLPAEILATIFICNARDSYINRKYDFSRPIAPDWINVSHVCRYWRDVALNCPTFWSYVPATSQHWTQELLARSQKAPLKICAKFIPHVDYEDRLPQVLSFLEQLTNDSQRIEKLDFDFDISGQQWYYDALSEFLSLPFPRVQHLALSLAHLYLTSEVEHQSLSFEAITSTPALHTLRLRRCSVPWCLLRLSALTTLYLDFVELPFPGLEKFLAFLRRTPQLVHLHVHQSLPSARGFLFSGECDATPKINLLHLSDMSIDAPLSAVTALLSCVDIPLNTKVELECEPEDGSTLDDYTRLASLLAQRIYPCSHPIPPVPRFDTLAIDEDEPGKLAFKFSSSDDDGVYLSVDLHLYEVTFGTVDQILSHICRSIPLTSIRRFYFSRILPMPSYFWRDILASLPSVRHIRLRGGYMPSIVSMISHPSDDHPGNKEDELAPALEELELQNVVLSTARGTDLESLCWAISTKETRCRLTITEYRVQTDKGFQAFKEFRLE